MRIFLIVGLIALSNCVQFSLLKRCACSEYDKSVCDTFTYCAWSGTSCEDLDCSYLKSANICTGPNTEYTCAWNIQSFNCESHTYSCSEISKDDCEKKYYGYHCIWDNDRCSDYSCKHVQFEECNKFTCSMNFENNVCDDSQNIDCSSFSTEQACIQTDGNGNICYFNNDSKCLEYDFYSKDCSYYSDAKEICTNWCTYVESTKTCQPKSCSDFTTENKCSVQLDLAGLNIIPCTWSGIACVESTAADLEKLDTMNCLTKTMLNYKWSSETNKCTACTSLTSNPLYQFLEDYFDGDSSSIQIIGMIVGLSFILN